jgi:hypothetical protein
LSSAVPLVSSNNRMNMEMLPPNLRKLCGTDQNLVVTLLSALACAFQTPGGSSGGNEMKDGVLTEAIIAILKHSATPLSPLFDGKVIASVAQLTADVINSDPQCLKHVHQSGLGKALLDILTPSSSSSSGGGGSMKPQLVLPSCPELLSVIPGVLSVLCLTADGLEIVNQHAPFSSLFQYFVTEKYSIPNIKAPPGELVKMIAKSLDELLHYQPTLRVPCMKALITNLEELCARLDSSGDEVCEELHKYIC